MKLSEINIYPIKSLKGISLNESKVEQRGLQYDRRWMLIDEIGEFFTQREFPKMATMALDLAENGLKVSTDSFEDLFVPHQPANDKKKRKVRVWQSICDAIESEKEINQWFSEVLQTKCRLVYMPDESRREVNALFNRDNDIVSFADGFPFLIIGENSLNDLNSRLKNEVPMNRFRPNFVVQNSAAFAEDNWNKLSIGNTIFYATKPCVRCVITTIDQRKGFFTGKEPLKTLANYRLAKDIFPNNFQSFDLNKNAVLFGQNLIAENFGETLKIGDEIKILA
jgi:uncharacterized protein YcbX